MSVASKKKLWLGTMENGDREVCPPMKMWMRGELSHRIGALSARVMLAKEGNGTRIMYVEEYMESVNESVFFVFVCVRIDVGCVRQGIVESDCGKGTTSSLEEYVHGRRNEPRRSKSKRHEMQGKGHMCMIGSLLDVGTRAIRDSRVGLAGEV
ncbi:hypothetical protein LINPERHAP1_LOCUS20194 [Linum perenne]